jgi:uncharacterized membrane protein
MIRLRKDNTKELAITSMLAALIFVFTFFIYFPVTGLGAYMNFGDCVIYCSGILIGAPWAAAAAAFGSAVADIAHGSFVYAPATVIIKGMMGFLCATLLYRRKNNSSADKDDVQSSKIVGLIKRNIDFFGFILICIIGGAIMVVGYGIYELVLWGLGYVTATIVPNLVQWGVGVAGAVALYYPVKRIKGIL